MENWVLISHSTIKKWLFFHKSMLDRSDTQNSWKAIVVNEKLSSWVADFALEKIQWIRRTESKIVGVTSLVIALLRTNVEIFLAYEIYVEFIKRFLKDQSEHYLAARFWLECSSLTETKWNGGPFSLFDMATPEPMKWVDDSKVLKPGLWSRHGSQEKIGLRQQFSPSSKVVLAPNLEVLTRSKLATTLKA